MAKPKTSKAPKPQKPQLPLGAVLYALDKRQGDWLANQPPDLKDAFEPYPLLRYLSNVPDTEAARMICQLNEQVNIRYWALRKHPQLLFRLMAQCGAGRRLDHAYTKPAGRRLTGSAALYAQMLVWYPEANDAELGVLLREHDAVSFQQLLDHSGVQPGDAEDLLADFKKHRASL